MMKSFQTIVCCIFFCFLVPSARCQIPDFGSLQDLGAGRTTEGCRILSPPRHGKIECSDDNTVCHVTCHAWATLHGDSPILLCDEESGKWSSQLPYCSPDFSSCTSSSSSSYKCPVLRQEDPDAFRLAYGSTDSSSSSEEDLINLERELIARIRSKRSTSGGATRKKSLNCHEAFCTKPCAAFPKVRYANLCRMCKRRKFCYNIGYSLF